MKALISVFALALLLLVALGFSSGVGGEARQSRKAAAGAVAPSKTGAGVASGMAVASETNRPSAVVTRSTASEGPAAPASINKMPTRVKTATNLAETAENQPYGLSIACPLLASRPYRKTLGYPCLKCAAQAASGALVGSKTRSALEADQLARSQALTRLREHQVISAIDTRSSATLLWVTDTFNSLNLESKQKVVDLVFTHCVVGDHEKNMLLIYGTGTRQRVGTFTESRGLRLVEQLVQRQNGDVGDR